jgi:hypothetical protein
MQKRLIDNILSTYPTQVRALLNHYRISDANSFEALSKGANMYGPQFVNDLYEITFGNSLSSADGEPEKSKPQLMELISAGLGLANKIINRKQPEPKPEPKILGVQPALFFGMVTIVVLVVVLIVIRKK